MKKYDTLLTPYEKSLDRACPWDEYPRTSMVRDSFFSLNGEWDFAVTDGSVPTVFGKILVPFPPESALSGYEKRIPRGSVMHYRRTFTLPRDFMKDRLILHFGAVDTVCRVYLNGKELFTNEGGYLPFSIDLTDGYLPGENTLSLSVTDELSKIYPYGKQKHKRGGMWYTPVSGIWQTVWLESVPASYIEKISVNTDMKSATVRVLGGEEKKTITVSGSSYEFFGDTFTFRPAEANLWSPESPYIYDFTLRSGDDEVRSYFALREIGTAEIDGVPRLTLNGEPYLFNGLLDQGYFPDGIFLPATSEGYREDILTAKSLGFNMLRKHIKVEPEVFYTLCDRLGMVVFQDMVNNSGYSFILDTALPTIGLKRFPDNFRHRNKRARKIFTEHSIATVEHLNKFPSVLYYTVFNEGWGQFSADRLYEIIKACAPSRIVDATSGWFLRHKSDVDSRHVYFKPVRLGKLTERPIVISEFGGYSHRVEGHLYGSANYGYKLFESASEFEDAFIKLYEKEILPLVTEGISALVYTQLSDVEDETNGLITYDRKRIKISKDRCAPLMKRICDAIKGGKD